MELFIIETGNFKLDGGAMFGVVPKSLWQKLIPADEHNMCTWAMRCLLIKHNNRLILVDTGIGNKQSDKFFGHYFLHGNYSLDSSLQTHGFTRNDITDVILTHLHFDHVGGAIVKNENDELISAFKNANFWSNQRHWDWAINPNAREKASFLTENILPIEQTGKLNMVDVVETGTVPFDNMDGLSMRFAFGHTDAMMLPQITINGQTVVYMADLLPSAAHVPLPYVMAYDMFPMKTLQEKQAFLQEAADNNYILLLEHDAQFECCRVHNTPKGVRVSETGTLASMLSQ